MLRIRFYSLRLAFTATVLASSLQVPLAMGQQLCVSRLPDLPTALSNNAVTAVDNGDDSFSLYSFLGITDPTVSGTATTAAYRLDWPDGNWSPIADAPALGGRGKVGASAAVVAGEIYLIGGYRLGLHERTERRLFRYDAATDTYIQKADVPSAVDDTVVGVWDDRYLFLTSGWHGPISDNVLNVQIYDTVTNTWEQGTPLPGPATGLFGHAGTLIGDRLIAFDGVTTPGGFQIADRVFVGRIDAQNTGEITNIAWSELPAHPGLPTYRAAASQGATAGGRLLVVGGTENPYNVSGTGYNGQPAFPLDQALAFDPVTGDWAVLAVVGEPLPTMDHRGLVRVADGWVTIGGMTAPGTATDAVLFYREHSDGTVCVPEPGCGAILLGLLFFRGTQARGRWDAGKSVFDQSKEAEPY